MAIDLPYFPLYVKDFAADSKVEAMSTEEVGAYILLLCKAWHERPPGSLPADDAVLARWARLSSQRWSECKSRVLSCFEQRSDGRWHQKRMASEFRKLTEQRSNRSAAGKKGAAKKWSKPPPDGNAIGVAIDPVNGKTMASESESESESSEVEKGGAGEEAKGRAPPEFDLTPEGLAQRWSFALTRKNWTGYGPQDKPEKVVSSIAELIRVGVNPEAIRAEIDNPERDRDEWLTQFRDRLKRNANVNSFRRETVQEKIFRLNAAQKGGSGGK